MTLSPWQDARIVELCRAGLKLRAIAGAIGCSHTTVSEKLIRAGETARRARWASITWTPDMLETLRRMRAEGKSFRRCALRIGVSDMTAWKKCVELGWHQEIRRTTDPRVLGRSRAATSSHQFRSSI